MLTFGTLTLEWPWAFALLPLPWLVWKLLPALSSTQAALYMPLLGERKIERSTHTRNRPSWIAIVLLALVWILLLAAAAKPVRYGDAVELPATGRDLLLAVDISGSMQIEDMALGSRTVNRLVAVKAVVKEFIERRKGDRLGLVLFGTNAYLQAPLTFDLPTCCRRARLALRGNRPPLVMPSAWPSSASPTALPKAAWWCCLPTGRIPPALPARFLQRNWPHSSRW